MDNSSARNLWGDYLDKHLEDAFAKEPKVICFSDDEKTANTAIKLIAKGIKKATTHSLLVLQMKKKKLPKIGDFTIVTDTSGKAKCIIRTTQVRLKPFFSVDEAYVSMESDSGKNLTEWKKNQWDNFTKELEPFARKPRESMIVVCEKFEKVFER